MATLIVDDDLHERLRSLAETHDLSLEAVVREAVEQMLERERDAARLRPDFIAEADASWRKFQRDGLHITGDELDDWARNWGKDQARPACHS